MAVEISALTSLLERLQAARRQQQEAAPASPPTELPEWSRRLNPEDFQGRTKEILMAAQQPTNQAPKGDLQVMPAQPRQAPISSATRERLAPVSEPRQRIVGQEAGYSPEIAAHMGRETEERVARRDQVAREDAVHPHPGQSPHEQPTHVNLRRAPHVGGKASHGGGAGMAPGGLASHGGSARGYGFGGGGGGMPGGPPMRSGGAPIEPGMRAEPAAYRGGGGGGGGGMGWRALLGGAGALMQELDGQRGAMGRFMQVHGQRRAAALEANQTRSAAISLGMDPELVEQMPISVLTPMLSKLYEQRNTGPEYGFMNVDGTVVRTDKRGGTVSPVYEGAGGQTIPGTNIDADTDMGRRYSAYVNQGFSHEQALGVASGRYELKVTDTGQPVMVDSLANREVPIERLAPTEIGEREQLGPTPGRQQQGQAQQTGQPDPLGLNPQQQKTLYEMADSGTGIWNIMGDFVGRVGPQFVPGDKPFFTDQREAVSTIQTANRGLIRALQQSPRYAEGERTSIERELALNPSIGMSPEAWRESAAAVDRLLRTWWTEDMQDARSSTLAAEDRQRALASARAIERYLQILGVPEAGGQTGGQGGTGIAPGTIAVHPQTGQRIRLNESGEWDEVQ